MPTLAHKLGLQYHPMPTLLHRLLPAAIAVLASAHAFGMFIRPCGEGDALPIPAAVVATDATLQSPDAASDARLSPSWPALPVSLAPEMCANDPVNGVDPLGLATWAGIRSWVNRNRALYSRNFVDWINNVQEGEYSGFTEIDEGDDDASTKTRCDVSLGRISFGGNLSDQEVADRIFKSKTWDILNHAVADHHTGNGKPYVQALDDALDSGVRKYHRDLVGGSIAGLESMAAVATVGDAAAVREITGNLLRTGYTAFKRGERWILRKGTTELTELEATEVLQAAKKAQKLLGPGTRFGAKIEGQLAKRGWTKELVQSTIDKPARTVPWRDTRHMPGGGTMDDAATAYYSQRGGYVVRSNRTGDIIQVSDRTDPGWIAPWE